MHARDSRKINSIVDGNNLFAEYASDYYHVDKTHMGCVLLLFMNQIIIHFIFIPVERAACA